MTLAVRKNLQNAPLFYWHAFRPKARIQLSIDFPVGLRQQISEVLGDGFTRQSCHGFGLCFGFLDDY
jgi:hypothetical protein